MIATHENLLRKGLIQLLEIKDSSIRLMTLEQCREAVDKGIHIGGAFSATIPLVSLFYGGVMRLDFEQPTKYGQDMFVLSKGHAVAAMASIYADLGYFDRSVLKNSRSQESLLNGHPGPILPGVHISTGPLGQGLGIAQGFALAGKQSPHFNVFCLTGDGELQEGPIWEAAMFSSYKKLDNLCAIIDKNQGQLDVTKHLVFPLTDLEEKLTAFGWRVFTVDGTQYGPVLDALHRFINDPRDGRPTAIICEAQKGEGGFSEFMMKHKANLPDELIDQEAALHQQRLADRITEFLDFHRTIEDLDIDLALRDFARRMNLDLDLSGKKGNVTPVITPVRTKRAPVRQKAITYSAERLPRLDPSKEYSAGDIITQAMKVFAQDRRVASIDADLSSTSGLQAGVGFVDMSRALNVGVAEANMMCIGEAFAALGYNAWVSTFCPFFDWKVLRRIAVGYQERLEAIAMPDGWLNEGHGLDLTFVATAPNFETTTNGATHMGNDDIQVFDGIAHLKIIDISCPNQLLAAMKWVMEGNKGLVYLRIMRAPSGVIYDQDVTFDFGKGYILKEHSDDKAVMISSGRGVHEALNAAKLLEQAGIMAGVVDMPSIDEKLLRSLYDSGKLLVFAEQNNGYIWSECRKILFKHYATIDAARLLPINTLNTEGKPQFIHSATYKQLLQQFGLAPQQLAERIQSL
ncbi:transketolase domain protein [Candidatus Vecturithrix granuli]|uniref:Transketolase domain protein n=1 Tax=Vecturithrix granuli TaxID=1499967 RepID=A0A081C5R7_VECG1|nr:transketolase domain protein [Candidatus Vecturithrix granuli]